MGTSLNVADCNSWFAYVQPRPGALMRLFCFPYAGGGASLFRTWADGLPEEIEVWPVQLPGRENRRREPAFTCITPLLSALTDELFPFLEKPFLFFGHSMGARVGFALAHYLSLHLRLSPLHIFLSGYSATSVDSLTRADSLSDAALIDQLRALEGTPEAILNNEDLLQILLPTLRADLKLCGTALPQRTECLTCPLSVFGGRQDPGVPVSELSRWCEYTTGTFTLRLLPGNHFFLRNAQESLLQSIAFDAIRSFDERRERWRAQEISQGGS